MAYGNLCIARGGNAREDAGEKQTHTTTYVVVRVCFGMMFDIEHHARPRWASGIRHSTM